LKDYHKRQLPENVLAVMIRCFHSFWFTRFSFWWPPSGRRFF